ncbi:hypothetical protein, unlikely [Trypanosoma brucei gambiense DAL972]|uniref:Uncharacterized protein n=1 Tax=Trypanosoma brucei gambiense (strain MHOM/CI/86/DAL972) TaxID=679716 RepID=D0A227_TRYB9|nr:hypothetical protein, unlikely [Trypanosoma brucei gambiense DAL972]CBH15320.1 hypothetical protein, unlikely [Trypanosoma brucei gambiense DAL972]|eukprot:XP_011777585.1 hypothetical protein, unlikely [Trypanosoma brucei gambiense DAL972]
MAMLSSNGTHSIIPPTSTHNHAHHHIAPNRVEKRDVGTLYVPLFSIFSFILSPVFSSFSHSFPSPQTLPSTHTHWIGLVALRRLDGTRRPLMVKRRDKTKQ